VKLPVSSQQVWTPHALRIIITCHLCWSRRLLREESCRLRQLLPGPARALGLLQCLIVLLWNRPGWVISQLMIIPGRSPGTKRGTRIMISCRAPVSTLPLPENENEDCRTYIRGHVLTATRADLPRHSASCRRSSCGKLVNGCDRRGERNRSRC
jgi:hypothetical protein